MKPLLLALGLFLATMALAGTYELRESHAWTRWAE